MKARMANQSWQPTPGGAQCLLSLAFDPARLKSALCAVSERMHPFRCSENMQPGKPTQRVLDMLSPSEVEFFGELPGEAVLGVYGGPDMSIEHFSPNQAFIEFLHGVLADWGARCSELIESAREQGEGWQYLIDHSRDIGNGPLTV